MCCIVLSLPARATGGQQKITLGIAETCELSHQVIVDEFYSEIFARVGVKVFLKRMPLKRIQYEIEQQSIDGDFLRPRGFSQKLVMVDSPLFPLSYSAYAKGDAKEVMACARSLVDGGSCGLKIGYIRGAFIPGKEMLAAVRFPKTYPLNSYESGLNMLAEGRIDLFLGSDAIANCMAVGPFFKDSGIKKVLTISEIDGYIYLHKKHEELALRLKSVIDAMRADGSFDRILHEIVSRHGAN